MLENDGDLPLRWVLMMSFDRAELSGLVFGPRAEEEIMRWPGSFYALAAAELRGPSWARRRVELRLESRLAGERRCYERSSLAGLSSAFRDAAAVFAGRELAAILWILIERGQPAAQALAVRLARDLEVTAARHLFRESAPRSHLGPPRSPEADRLSAIG